MREQFPWFLDPTEEELQRLWDEATFSFDANVLLNLYRVDRETTEDYFKIFRAFGDRIYLPHESANQFFLRRRGVIRTEQNSFSKAKAEVEKWVERRKVFDDIKDKLRGDDIGQIIEGEIESVFENREEYEEEVEAVKEDLIDRIEDLEERFTPTGTTRANPEEDEILGELVEIFEGKTGSRLDEDIRELKEKARERYNRKKPPGYEDYDGEDELNRGESEDFLIWKQLMEFAEREGEDIVFVTGEEKPDWWEVDRNHNIVRPRHELLREFKTETGQVYWMLSTERMLDSAYKRLGIEVRDKSVEQTGKVGSEERGASEGELNKALKLRNISDDIDIGKKNILDFKSSIESTDEVSAIKLSREVHLLEGVVMDEIERAINVSNQLERSVVRAEVKDRFDSFSAAALSGSEAWAKSCAADLVDYLATVTETLRNEADELVHSSLMSSVSY